MEAARPSARAAVWRNVLLFTPFLALTLTPFALLLADVLAEGLSGGRLVGLVLIGSVALLLAYQVVQAVRDLFASLTETVGTVDRLWSRNDLFLFRSSYAFVAGNVFRLTEEHLLDASLGDRVRIVHYPHTGSVASVEVLPREAEDAEAGG